MSAPRILVQRAGALGDVLLTTPIVHRLRKELGPDAVISINTGSPAAYENNPHITHINDHSGNYDRVIDLNLTYERDPKKHIIDAYMQAAFGDDAGPKRTVFGLDPPAPEALKLKANVVVLHATRSWPSRSLPDSYWESLITLLIAKGYNVIMLGGGNDYSPAPREGFANLIGQTSLRQTASEISNARAAILSDSSLLHLAGATDTPILGLFTSVKAEYRIPYRRGILGWNADFMYPIGLPCYGCLETKPPPVIGLWCERNDNICTTLISAEDTIFKMEQILR